MNEHLNVAHLFVKQVLVHSSHGHKILHIGQHQNIGHQIFRARVKILSPTLNIRKKSVYFFSLNHKRF
jgi:hypothetical protein